jgi:protein-tyrosine phosphatase
MKRFGILFVCLGNICRSPLAEGIFRKLLAGPGLEDNFIVDSCGIMDWNTGSSPHLESQRIARKNGISLKGQEARKITVGDFKNFDLILAMDRENLRDLDEIAGSYHDKICCLREYDTDKSSLDVPDPINGGPEDFEKVFRIISRCCRNLLDSLEGKNGG